MATSYYGKIIYGASFYGSGIGGIDAPDMLTYHHNENPELFTLYWTFNVNFISPILPTLDWELQVSADNTFPVTSTLCYFKTRGTAIAPVNNSTKYYEVVSVTDAEIILNEPYTGETVTSTFNKTPYPYAPSEPAESTATATFTNGSATVSGTGFLAEAVIPLDPAKTPIYNFQDGNCIKAYDITVPTRSFDGTQTLYARVRTINGSDKSEFSPTISFSVLKNYREQFSEFMLNTIPDEHVYNKDILILPYDQRNTNLYNIFRMYSTELDIAQLDILKKTIDTSIEIGRDESLFDNFASYFDITKPPAMSYIQYRLIIKSLYESIIYFGTNYSINRIVAAFTGMYPTIENIRDIAEFIVYDDVMYKYVVTETEWSRLHDYNGASEYVIAINLTSDKDEGGVTPNGSFIGDCRIVNNWDVGFTNSDVQYWTGAEWSKIATLADGQKYVIGVPLTGSSFVGHDNEIATYSAGSFTYAAPVDGAVVAIRRENNQMLIQNGSYVFDVATTESPIIYDRSAMASGIRIKINNPGGFDLSPVMDLLKRLISKVIPIHVYYEVI